jgi:hypothetical protein
MFISECRYADEILNFSTTTNYTSYIETRLQNLLKFSYCDEYELSGIDSAI